MVFPEGTRSYDNQVKRFHKGAFYLAEKLGLDIVPVFIHGNGDVLPKGDMLIFPGTLRPLIGQRIAAVDLSFGVTYAERTKAISTYYKEQYRLQRLELEDVTYFIPKIKLAYLYKDDEIVFSVRNSLDRWKEVFYQLNRRTQAGNRWLHWSDSYGELDYLLSLQQGKRKIVGWIADDVKRKVADSIYWSKNRSVHFVEQAEVADILLISKKLLTADYTWDGWQNFPIIINIDQDNNLNFLGSRGFILESQLNGVATYRREGGDGEV